MNPEQKLPQSNFLLIPTSQRHSLVFRIKGEFMKFEKISKYLDNDDVILPRRATAHSAGYDLRAAEDILVPHQVWADKENLWSVRKSQKRNQVNRKRYFKEFRGLLISVKLTKIFTKFFNFF